MPLFVPFVLIGGSALLSGTGIKKGADGVSKFKRARQMVDAAHAPYAEAHAAAQAQHELAVDALRRYGELKYEIYDSDLRAFVTAWKRLGAGELSAPAGDPELRELVEELQLEAIDFTLLDAARSILAGGGTAAASWAAAWGAVGTFGSASTGAAISGLTGAAASNAIMAWFSGGSLAAGGLGAGAGVGIFAGVVAGPAIAITGMMLDAKGNKALDQAREHVARLNAAKAEANAARATYRYLDRLAGDYAMAAGRIRKLFAPQLAVVEQIAATGVTLQALDREQRTVVAQAANTAAALKALLETPLLDASTGRQDETASERLEQLRDRLGI